MRVIDLIQNMQASIDALSFHSADTEVALKPGGMGALTGAIEIGDPDTDGKITVELAANPIKFDFDLLGGKVGVKDLFSTGVATDLWDKLTIANNKPKVDDLGLVGQGSSKDTIPTPTSWAQSLDSIKADCAHDGEDNGDGIVFTDKETAFMKKHEALHAKYVTIKKEYNED